MTFPLRSGAAEAWDRSKSTDPPQVFLSAELSLVVEGEYGLPAKPPAAGAESWKRKGEGGAAGLVGCPLCCLARGIEMWPGLVQRRKEPTGKALAWPQQSETMLQHVAQPFGPVAD